MLENLCSDVFRLCIEFSGIVSTLNLFFVSSHLKNTVGNLSVTKVNNLFSRESYFRRDESCLLKKIESLTIDVRQINVPIKDYTSEVWKLLFQKFTLTENLYPKCIQKVIEQHYYQRWESSDSRLKNYICQQLQLTKKKCIIEPRFCKQLQHITTQKFPNIIQLFSKDFESKHIFGQKIQFPNLLIQIKDETIQILELSFFLKKSVKWGTWQTSNMEIIIKKDKDVVGVIDLNSNYFGFPAFPEILTFLEKLEKYHVFLCGEVGKITKRCVFCRHNLSDNYSLLNGYGLTCAKTHGLLNKKRKME